QVHAQPQSGLDLVQLCAQPLRLGDALELKTPVPGVPADVREAKKPERLRLPEATRLPSLGGEPAELDQPRLLGRQHQAELRKPAAKVIEEPARILLALETDDVVVSEARDDHLTMRVSPSPLVGPQVKHIMEVDV